MKLLTKSKYLSGVESDTWLWRLVNDKESLPDPDAFTQSKFAAGTEVGILAKQLYEGEDLDGLGFIENIRKTKELIRKRKTIFEGGFMINKLFARCDILIPVNNDQWDLIEVKSSTSVKEIHSEDLAFQKYVLEKSGISIRNCFVININKQYVRHGELNIKDFFEQTDVTFEVSEIYPDVPKRIERMLEIIVLPSCPKFDYHDILKTEYGNPCIDEFIETLPEGSVFELYNARKTKIIALLDKGIQLITEIPDNIELTNNQEIQKKCLETSSQHVNIEGIKLFLSGLQYPIYHLDFETYDSVIPLFDGMRPNTKIPFQFSLHIEQADGSICHKEFLFTEKGDCRLAFLNALKRSLGDVGTVLVYNQAFELGRLKELAEVFPDFAAFISSVITRVQDLLIPFRNFYFYDVRQKGSCSIKAILPIFSNLSYKSLAITNGSKASLLYFTHFVKGVEHPDRVALKKDLLEYCKLDTYGMVQILRRLKEKAHLNNI